MAIKYINEDLVNKKINIVNTNNHELKSIGLLPKYINAVPAFINLSKEPVYVCTDHLGSILINDIKRCLDMINQDEKVTISNIEKEYKNIYKNNKKIINSYDITDYDTVEYLGKSANIFEFPMNYRKDIKGIYNDNAKIIINPLKTSKINIYSCIKDLFINSKNINITITNLLGILSNYELEGKNIKLEQISEISQYFLLDILIQLIGFDKIEIRLKKTITTSKINIYEEFFNYILMDYTIVQVPKIIFNKDSNDFKIIRPNKLTRTRRETEYEEEIQLIKKLVPKNQISKYFLD